MSVVVDHHLTTKSLSNNINNNNNNDNDNDKDDNFNYGIVIDSGSSGSRIQIYKWINPINQKLSTKNQSILQSPPKIIQEKNWTKKITPGISTFNSKSKFKKIWSNHYSDLMKFASEIIPESKHYETPVFILSTAGMRLLPEKISSQILKETCISIQQNTNFYLPNCENFVQIIDGSSEGLYGWIGLNYLMNTFNNYVEGDSTHESIGFMDMGGASTQIAFVPSSIEEIEKHNDDLSKVVIRNINGETQVWNAFVATWLGFGANEARKRFLNQLIQLSIINKNDDNIINDPCLPKGATLNYIYDYKGYLINGIGNYEMCIKTIYPLLMKTIPCKEEPCLFNGIHGPKLNFKQDKFVGISEYWYTANDIFHSGGEYNFKVFNKKVKEFCESNWDQILINSQNGDYSNLDPNIYLVDACFKASWVMNILHEGFELPRIGFEVGEDDDQKLDDSDKVTNVHVPFKSADSVEGEELSWTLGRILLYASSQIQPSNSDIQYKNIGIYPSEISGKKFIPGGAIHEDLSDDDDNNNNEIKHVINGILIFILIIVLLFIFRKLSLKGKKFQPPINIKRNLSQFLSKVPGVRSFFNDFNIYQNLEQQNIQLEEGGFMRNDVENLQNSEYSNAASVLRTRSAIGISEEFENRPSIFNNQNKSYNPRFNSFINKPFTVPSENEYKQQFNNDGFTKKK
ncbi:unnamed protein product [Candida verbasci]|uniref:Golgi apyrase n=1 Tax=Candida verbasci TaxID=1227364 RepID=A0A9W4TZP9_9ASCO|nr:unnamed protein product [Candida verbasci]